MGIRPAADFIERVVGLSQADAAAVLFEREQCAAPWRITRYLRTRASAHERASWQQIGLTGKPVPHFLVGYTGKTVPHFLGRRGIAAPVSRRGTARPRERTGNSQLNAAEWQLPESRARRWY